MVCKFHQSVALAFQLTGELILLYHFHIWNSVVFVQVPCSYASFGRLNKLQYAKFPILYTLDSFQCAPINETANI